VGKYVEWTASQAIVLLLFKILLDSESDRPHNANSFFIPFSASRFEVWFLSAYFGIHLEADIFTTYRGRTLHLDEISNVWDVEYLILLFKVAKKLKRLKLSGKERALLKALVVLLSG
jgi:hypothetical protein